MNRQGREAQNGSTVIEEKTNKKRGVVAGSRTDVYSTLHSAAFLPQNGWRMKDRAAEGEQRRS